jgi:hypothetical protein
VCVRARVCVYRYYLDEGRVFAELRAVGMAKSELRRAVVRCARRYRLRYVSYQSPRLVRVALILIGREVTSVQQTVVMSVARVDPPRSVEFIGAYFFTTGRKHSIKRFRFDGFLRLVGNESGLSG